MDLQCLTALRARWLCFALLCLCYGSLFGCVKAQSQQVCSKHTDYKFAYSLCEIDNTPSHLANGGTNHSQLAMYWWHEQNEKPFYTFDELAKHLDAQGKQLVFATNGGMYTDDYAPLAYYVQGGKQLMSLNLKEGGGNFHLLPNGVFWLSKDGIAQITESHAFDKQKLAKKAAFATQSGPMLVINGELHPQFRQGSESVKMRNGVGICKNNIDNSAQDKVKFVTSDVWVNFYDFARLFKDKLGCEDALFLDGGRASALYSTELKRNDSKFMGVIIGYSQDK